MDHWTTTTFVSCRRFVRRDNTRLKRLVMEADPAFSSINVDQLLLHVLGDVLAGAPAIEAVKILAAQVNKNQKKEFRAWASRLDKRFSLFLVIG